MYEGFDEVVAFAAVANTGSFKAAGVQLGRDASVISRRLSQLESRLGVRLLVRTTRSVSLTEAGTFYFRRIRSVLDKLDQATREVGDFAATPQGELKLSLPVTYGREVIAPLIPDFLLKYPRIHIDAHFLDRMVDIVSEGFDVVIRIGMVGDSSLIARKLGTFRSRLIASPSYVARKGMPASPDELLAHSCLGFTHHPDWPNWVIEMEGEQKTLRPQGPFVANSSESIIVAALKGAGIALAPDWMVAPHLKAGSLVEVLPGWRSVREISVHAVMPPGALVPAKTRVFVDEIGEALRPAMSAASR
ncbi:LysR family transcriptional regulator [Corallococcus carmarthensis]|uniref:LysR family transcriptional regulator n=1 Tax=Corallococcus carmarthensis TaxID=2316728 RepID=A0A3A8K944_9BACT|nr:LysR family transcriptional regulator [Corallococcus carmarthensis]RKG98313.1 LysR family transcriptional regulator [Corallococcus carmarthensis]